MNENLSKIDKDLSRFKKDLEQVKTELTKQETIRQSLVDQLYKEYGLKHTEIDKRLEDIKKEKITLMEKVNSLSESIKKQFAKVFGD